MDFIHGSERDGLSNYTHERNVAGTNKLLAALSAVHAELSIVPALVKGPLPPISNEAIAQASSVAFPSWVSAIKRIQHAVCAEYSVTLSELCSQRRNVKIVRPRQIGMYLCKTLTDRSYPEIGRRFGGRDHTTVIAAVRRIEALCISDEALRSRVVALQESIA